jgi:hypothetical protein
MLENSEERDRFDISTNLKELEAYLVDKPAAVSSEKVKLEGGESSLRLDKFTFESLKKQGNKVYHIQFELKEGETENYSTPLEFFREIEKMGEIIERSVDMELVLRDDSFTGEGIPLNIIYSSVLDKDMVAHIFGIEERRVKELKDVS